MSFQRPTLAQLVDRVQADFVSRLDLASAVLRRAVVWVLARVVAGAAHMLHAHLEFLGLQLFPDKSIAEFLVRQASLFGITRNPADYAKAELEATGTNGTVIPEGAILIKDGLEYETDAEVTIAGGVAALDVTAVEAGAAATLTVGMVLAFESPVTGLNSSAEVTAVTQDGVEEETEEELRIRLLEHMSDPPHGGTDADYVAWAKQVPGVTRVWVTPKGLGPGTVVVRFVRDDDVSIFPDAGEVAAVQAKLDEEAPAHADPTAVAPIASSVAFLLSIVPDTSEMQAAVEAEIDDFYNRTAAPGGEILISQLRTAIGNTPGLTNFTLTTPAGDVSYGTGVLPQRGSMTYV